jgi:hypothetical protein
VIGVSLIIGSFRQRRSLIDHESAEKGAVNAPLTTIGLYLFLIGYAVTLFLIQAVLVPRTWDGTTSLKDYFLERRLWFYSLLLFATILDQIDSYLKGGFEYLLDTGPTNLAFAAVTLPVVLIGIKSANLRFHNFVATAFLGWQVLLGFGVFGYLVS